MGRVVLPGVNHKSECSRINYLVPSDFDSEWIMSKVAFGWSGHKFGSLVELASTRSRPRLVGDHGRERKSV